MIYVYSTIMNNQSFFQKLILYYFFFKEAAYPQEQSDILNE